MTKITSKGLILLLIATPVLLLIELALAFFVFQDIQRVNRIESSNSRMDLYIRTNMKYVANAESAQRGYLITGDTKYKETFQIDVEELAKNEEYFDTLPDSEVKRHIMAIQLIADHKVSEMGHTIQLYDADRRKEAFELVKTNIGKEMMDSMRGATTALRERISADTASQKRSEERLISLFFMVIAVLIFFNLYVAYATYRKLRDYTTRLESMIASLRETNARMSHYTSMSYHEMKTPLRNISGFARLMMIRHGGDINKEETQYITYIMDGAKQIDQTINSLREKYLEEPVPESEG